MFKKKKKRIIIEKDMKFECFKYFKIEKIIQIYLSKSNFPNS